MRVTIIGGGLSGVSVASLLITNPHFEIEVYESKEFSERGATVGLSRSALTALEQILPAAVDTLVEKAGAVLTELIRVMVRSGPNKGEFLFEIPNMKPRISVSRASLLKELLAQLPEEILHANMKLTSIDQGPSGVDITFEDGTTHHFDAVIGADGISSHVRDHILAGQERSSPAVRGTVDEEYLKCGQQYAFTADGALLLYTLVAGGTMSLTGAKLLLSDPSLHAYSQHEHTSTATYWRDNICLIGDAAHASTPWQGAGAGQALEDCVILATLLGETKELKDITKAFQVFDSVRAPRCKQIIQSSREVGNILCSPGNYETLEDWRKALERKWDDLYDFDLEAQEGDALKALRTVTTT
ncbi:salicylate hydroxylase [Xylaria sp. FL0064]|nr:salicylate hydroxylase [Xylaria sp. FL0064]